jgi:hypothetical protein
MFGMFKKKPIESPRLETLFIAHLSGLLRDNQHTSKEELRSSFMKALSRNNFTTTAEQDFAVTLACTNIWLSSDLKQAISSYRIEEDHTWDKLKSIRIQLAEHEVFLWAS